VPDALQKSRERKLTITSSRTTEETKLKKIAVSSDGPTLDDKVDPRFGRAGGFVIVDVDTMETEYINNGESQVMSHGAGIQAAEIVAGAGADVLLSGYVGPKAFQALSGARIAIGQNCDNLTVREAVERFLDGKIPVADAPNMER
jgi:predicted Fe-Mo cluster-binding NifX family protein